MWKDLLKRDFGLDLDIAGGSGQSREDPIHVLSSSGVDASRTEFLVLRGLCMGRGVLWRTLRVGFVPNTAIVQRKIETKEVQETEIITQTENYYFIRPNAERIGDQSISQYYIYGDNVIDLGFPYEISWLHFDGFVDYREKGRSDLGYSLEYGAPGIKATLYMYPCTYQNVDEDILRTEFDNTLLQIRQHYGDDEITHDWGGPRRQSDHILYYYLPKSEPKNTSSVLLMRKGPYFAKLRCSFEDEHVTRAIVSDFIAMFLALIRGGQTPAYQGDQEHDLH